MIKEVYEIKKQINKRTDKELLKDYINKALPESSIQLNSNNELIIESSTQLNSINESLIQPMEQWIGTKYPVSLFYSVLKLYDNMYVVKI